MDKSKKSFAALTGIFNKLSLQQKILIGGIAVVTVVMIGLMLFAFNEPVYTTLYNNLASDEAGEVVKFLSNKKIPYKLKDGGNTIEVPKKNVYQVRLELAGKGIPSSGMIGYEIFDQNTIGMSEFMQKLNFKRAMEGEIARTIVEQKGIKNARVHIVIPEKAVFKDQQKDATASVVLDIQNGYRLTENNITAITNLVAASVESLEPDKVTIVDTKGHLLSKEPDEEGLSVSSNKQYEIKGKIENYLSRKAKAILDKVLGYGNSDVKVNVDLDFTKIERTLENYDPESQVAISEQTSKNNTNQLSKQDSNQTSAESTTTNYELSKTIEHVIEGAGTIKRITVAAVINGIQKEIKPGETVNEPRSEEQLKQLEQLIRQAVGIDESRNDKVSIVSIPFENFNIQTDNDSGGFLPDNIGHYFNYLLILLGIIGAVIILKKIMKMLEEENIVIGSLASSGYNDEAFNGEENPPTWDPGLDGITGKKKKRNMSFLEVGNLEDEISDEALMKKAKQDKIINYVSKNPAEAAKLINSWLKEDEY